MIVHAFPSGPLETNAYVIACPSTKKAAIIDPAPGSSRALFDWIASNGYTVDKILLTHSHWDHLADAKQVSTHYHLPVYVHPLDAENLTSPGTDGIPCWIPIEGVSNTLSLQEGDKLPIGNLTLEVIHTPGHTPGGVCFFEKNAQVLLSGDTLFQGTIGNISFSTGRPTAMWTSLKKLAKLPKDTVVYPGHGPSTTIGQESWLDKAEEVFGSEI